MPLWAQPEAGAVPYRCALREQVQQHTGLWQVRSSACSVLFFKLPTGQHKERWPTATSCWVQSLVGKCIQHTACQINISKTRCPGGAVNTLLTSAGSCVLVRHLAAGQTTGQPRQSGGASNWAASTCGSSQQQQKRQKRLKEFVGGGMVVSCS